MLQQLPASKRHEILLRGCKAIPTTSHHLIWAVRSQQQSLRRYERLLTTGLGGRPGSLPPSTCIPETLLVPFPPLPLPPPASGCICTKKKKKKKKNAADAPFLGIGTVPVPRKIVLPPALCCLGVSILGVLCAPCFRPPCQYYILTSVPKPATPEGSVFKVFHTRRTAHRWRCISSTLQETNTKTKPWNNCITFLKWEP